ncbi:Unknown protein [Striga hermonthica]|uniref:No apical meristem-associated C-terminal domain-containing protein n=1 Tax=Striga hermonthica TaxID=68872 RepID=A0A9N7P459_STRHE|nr:Unknown protein [Striga hermonthica]
MRSLDSRYRLMETHCRRFNGCLKQIEYRNPSGTQIQDRIEQAERLFEQDPKYKDGFKFHHVFRLFKEFGKFDDNVSQPRPRRRDFDTLNDSSESDVPYDGQPTPESPGLSSFSPQQSDDGVGGTSSQRPMGAKKAKLKKKNEDQFCQYFQTLNAKSDTIVDLLQKADERQNVQLQLQKQQIDLQKKRDEDRILMIDLNSLTNPMIRRHWEQKQMQILQEREIEQQQSQATQPSSNTGQFGFLDDIGHDGGNLNDYYGDN